MYQKLWNRLCLQVEFESRHRGKVERLQLLLTTNGSVSLQILKENKTKFDDSWSNLTNRTRTASLADSNHDQPTSQPTNQPTTCSHFHRRTSTRILISSQDMRKVCVNKVWWDRNAVSRGHDDWQSDLICANGGLDEGGPEAVGGWGRRRRMNIPPIYHNFLQLHNKLH